MSFADDAPPPIEQLETWLDESYRAQAPKRLLREFDGPTDAALRRKAAKK